MAGGLWAKGIGFLILLVLLAGCAVVATAGVAVYYGSERAPVTPTLINGQIMVPITDFARFLGAEVRWDDDGKQVTVETDAKKLVMWVGQKKARINGREALLPNPPQVVDEQVVFPLRFLVNSFSLTLKWNAKLAALCLLRSPDDPLPVEPGKDDELAHSQKSTRVEGEDLSGEANAGPARGKPASNRDAKSREPAAMAQIDSISTVRLDGRMHVRVESESPLKWEAGLLTDPPRLVVDLKDARLGTGISDRSIGGPVLRQLRVNQFRPDVARIVLDLSAPTGYEIDPGPEGLEIILHHHVSGVQFRRDGERASLDVQTTGHPKWRVLALSEPERLVVDVFEATLACNPISRELQDRDVATLRVHQFLPDVVRIVLDLKHPVRYWRVPRLLAGGQISIDITGESSGRVALAAAGSNYPALPPNVEQGRVEEENKVAGLEFDPLEDGLLSGITVAIDPGHGGIDVGAVGPNGLFEKDVNLAIALKLADLLRKAGAKVVLTRNNDITLSLRARPQIAAAAQADVFLSIHNNAFGERDAKGTETLFNPCLPENRLLAAEIQRALTGELGTIDRGTKVREDLAVLRGLPMPGVLVEVAFIDHPHEERLLADEAFQRRAAEAVALGTASFLGKFGRDENLVK